MSTTEELVNLNTQEEVVDLNALEDSIGLTENNENTDKNKEEKEINLLDNDGSENISLELVTNLQSNENAGEIQDGTQKENPLLFTEDESTQAVPTKLAEIAKKTVATNQSSTLIQESVTENIIDSIKNTMKESKLSDTDFTDLCKIQKLDVNTILKTAKTVGMSREVVLYGLVNKKMGVPFEKTTVGDYQLKGLPIIEELRQRLETNEPPLTDKEFEDYCTFLGVKTDSVLKRSQELWLCKEEVLKGVLNLRMVGE